MRLKAAGGVCALVAALGCAGASAATLAEKAKESGCASKPVFLTGDMYKCKTVSGVESYFNVEGTSDADRRGSTSAARSGSSTTAKAPTPTNFPRVDPDTQKGRDDIRRKVLSDELATEQKLLAEVRTLYADGAPTPLPEERTDAQKYRDRIARLKQTLSVHERNVEALKKELSAVK